MPGPGGCLVPGGVWSREVGWWGVPGGDPWTAAAAGGTHPTGMHSCFLFCSVKTSLNWGVLVFLKFCKIICAHTLTLKLPIQTSLSGAPKLLVSLSSHEKCPNFRITSTPKNSELLSSEILDSSNVHTNKNLL